MKKVLIISPYFPPANSADMQRVRMSLPYFEQFNWLAEIVVVDPQYVDIVKDELLLKSLPDKVIVHRVKAMSKKWTSKLGLGSIALRSLLYYKAKVNELLKNNKYDLIYFSTTQFPVLILGSYWKKKFNIPFVIDMQDPWHSDYYEDKPAHERPPKYWFSYRLNKFLEPIAMKHVDGLISVSKAYLEDLENRYLSIKKIPKQVITFGAFEIDFDIAASNTPKATLSLDPTIINLVYIGRGGHDMRKALVLLFNALKNAINSSKEDFNRLKIHFIGTSYAPNGQGVPTILPIAKQCGVASFVNEITDRLPFYETLNLLKQADVLLILGSDDKQYTASKIYPYILAKRPILSFFHPESSASKIIQHCEAGTVISLQDENAEIKTIEFLRSSVNSPLLPPNTNWKKFEPYSAKEMTKKQCEVFDLVLKNTKN